MTRRWQSDGLEPVGARDHVRGPEGASVTLVKYGDYECPYCGDLHPVLERFAKRMTLYANHADSAQSYQR
jgi:protein-disulfide isomerase